MGILGNKRNGWTAELETDIRFATHVLCTRTGYMDDDVDEDGNPVPYALAGKVYKIEAWDVPGRTDGRIYIHSECCSNNDYGSHEFPSDVKKLHELGLLPFRKEKKDA